jgi:hypothetical protein
MNTLADFLNSPREIDFEGVVWKLRQPTLDEEGMFQVYLEQEEYNAIERRTYQAEDQKDRDRKRLNESCAIGDYEYGSALAVEAMSRPKGIAKMVEIVCRDQGMTLAIARRLVAHKLKEIALAFASKLEGMDPNLLGEIALRLGLPGQVFSSGSAPPPSTETSTSSAE